MEFMHCCEILPAEDWNAGSAPGEDTGALNKKSGCMIVTINIQCKKMCKAVIKLPVVVQVEVCVLEAVWKLVRQKLSDVIVT